ncbi:MAG: ZIP family metal transporter [Actinomycetota bacterium]|nr:ZIP family metal transporter [Actinomycetota bacterium]
MLALIAVVLATIAIVGDDTLPERAGPPIEELAVESTRLEPNKIELKVRNTGPDAVQIAQVFVADAFVDFDGASEPVGRLGSETITLDFPWQEGQPYLISLVTSTGAVIEHDIPVAVETPQSDGDLFALMALLGLYVGLIPVTLGMLLLPAMRRFRPTWIRVVMAVTVGLLAFLAVDASLEGFEIADESGGAFGGTELVLLGAGLAFMALTGVDRFLAARRGDGAEASGIRLALMIAIGIGLHNMGEGLAIGSAYAIGELALGAALVVGFAIHNTTEGFAIVAPLVRSGERPRLGRLAGLGLIAGAPAILGAVIGSSVTNPELSAFLLGLGVGAVVQVIVQIAPAMRDKGGRAIDAVTASGIAAGATVFYLTSLLISA